MLYDRYLSGFFKKGKEIKCLPQFLLVFPEQYMAPGIEPASLSAPAPNIKDDIKKKGWKNVLQTGNSTSGVLEN